MPTTTGRSALTAEDVRASLERHHGTREKVWRELGLKNRYALKRLIKKFNLADVGADREDG
jgi:hypothetical protein